MKKYLDAKAGELLEELKDYSVLLDPREYDTDVRRKRRLTLEDAKSRIAMYQSPFKGWSTYSVDGVFFAPDGKVFEEATQVARIMFRFQSSFVTQAEEAGCSDVLRSVLYWVIPRLGRIDEETGWSPAESKLYLRNHTAWPRRKRAFVEKCFTAIAKEAQRWNDDCIPFLCGYLVRRFWEKVIAKGMYEEEIWVTSHYTMNLNVIHRVER